MKYFLIAGEPSGDIHGAHLMHEIKQLDAGADFWFTGGDLMEREGGRMIRHYRYMSFMGIMAVIANLHQVMTNFRLCKKAILDYQPDVIFLIDYPGFNLRIARWAKKKGFRVFMYVSPTVWAWKENRVKTIKKCIDRLFVVLPFEVDFYRRHHYEVYYTGNPVFDVVEDFKEKNDVSRFKEENGLDERPVVALLAGSRKQEIRHLLPVMLRITSFFPDYQFVIAGSSSLPPEVYRPFLKDYPSVRIVYNQTYALLSNAFAAIVTSGTATLETALFNVPEVVVYKMEWPTYLIGRPLVRLTYFSLVNLILNRMAVKELLQFRLFERLLEETRLLLNDASYRESIYTAYKELRLLMQRGAYRRTAALAWEFLQPEKENGSTCLPKTS